MSRHLKKVRLSQVKVEDRLPLGLRTLSLIDHLRGGGSVPPIHVRPNGHGQFVVLDGRHRYLAHKMLEREWIEVRYGIDDPEKWCRCFLCFMFGWHNEIRERIIPWAQHQATIKSGRKP